MNDLSLTGLLDLGLSNEYTTIDGQVSPILSYKIGEAVTEHITFPNLATVSFIIWPSLRERHNTDGQLSSTTAVLIRRMHGQMYS
jgi:hypothetical protein